MRAGRLAAIATKIVDKLIHAGALYTTDHIILAISARVKFGTIIQGPGHLRYLALNLHQHDNYATTVDCDSNLDGLVAMAIFRLCIRDIDDLLTSVSSRDLASLNSTMKWLGMTAYPFCAAFTSGVEQLYSTATMK